MIKIYVGDVTKELQQYAISNDPESTIITGDNYLNVEYGVYYTSLGDLYNINNFVELLRQADILIYVAPPKWSDEAKGFSYMQYWTEFYLRYFKDKKQVYGLPQVDLTKFIEIASTRKSDAPQLWIAGCSISHGVGVATDERYGEILAKNLDRQVSFLTESGASIEWAADQIIRSDVKSGDIIVWGLTSVGRFPYFDTKVNHIHIGYSQSHKEFNKQLELLRVEGDDLLYRSIISVHQVINYCNKVGASVYFAGVLITHNVAKYFVDLPNYIQFYGYPSIDRGNLFDDKGSDNMHPGPLMHKKYASEILKLIKREELKCQ